MKYHFECISKSRYIFIFFCQKQMNGRDRRCNGAICKKTNKQTRQTKKRQNQKTVKATEGEIKMRSLQIIFKPYLRGISFLFGSVNAANSSVLQKKTAALETWYSEEVGGGWERGAGGVNWRQRISSCCAWGIFFLFFFFPSAGINRRPDCFRGLRLVFGGQTGL